MEENETDGYVVAASPGSIDFTPYYMATIACDLFHVTRLKSDNLKHEWYKYLLLCISIEAGLKAIILNNNNSIARKNKNKKMGHDIMSAVNSARRKLPDDFFTKQEEVAMRRISKFLPGNDLRYCSVDLIYEMVSGAKGIPHVSELETAAEKIVKYLEASNHLRASQTLQVMGAFDE